MDLKNLGRGIVVLLGGLLAAFLGWFLFVETATTTAELVGIIFVLLAIPLGFRVGGRISQALLPTYNVAEVSVEGPITRDRGGRRLPTSPPGTPGADEIVDLIEQADMDSNVHALIVKLNTPGGAVVPSEDIRHAVNRFDGPTIAYTTDVCASGGYWIASGCDELWARNGSIIGSIGVRGSRVTAADLLDRIGLSYEQFIAGEYKDAGVPLKEIDPDERTYLQGLVDGMYDQFVETVSDGRDMDTDDIRETDAKVYLGTTAYELGLIDNIGTRVDVEDRLTEILGMEVSVIEFEPTVGIASKLQIGIHQTAYALGAGIADQFLGTNRSPIRLD